MALSLRASATFVGLALITGTAAFGQAGPPVLTPAPRQKAIRDDLISKAATDPHGVSVGHIRKGPTSIVQMVVRVRTGEAEEHQLWADEITVREGEVDLITGGTMVGRYAMPGRPGEFRGTELVGDTTTTRLRPGDFVEIPAGTYHWMKVVGSSPTASFVIKIRKPVEN
ncbi:cupin domain-containing protein [Novosphingobium sp. BL-52-GroH]|uniref:cupin domain-containing protein n=1 Tax=Novosphingobium sp. BL-52-GroH TaxID=3349877 RepID=UPI00384D31BD